MPDSLPLDQMFELIVTHPGGAHKDELLACAVLLTMSPVAIERREPTRDDLENPVIAVVDVGHKHDPQNNNFDHHQFDRDHVPTCSLSLVLQHLGIYDDAREFCPWLEVTEWFDCRGPNDTAKWLGVDRDLLGRLNSPIEMSLLKRFASQTFHLPGEPVWEMLKMIGEDLVDFIRNLRTRLNFIAENAVVIDVPWGDTIFKALMMPRTDSMLGDTSGGLAYHVQTLGLENEVLALVYPDGRGEGYGLRKFNDTPLLDFSRIENEPDVHFAHARGFIAKTSATNEARLLELLAAALVK